MIIVQAAEIMRQIRDEERAGRGALYFIGKTENSLKILLI